MKVLLGIFLLLVVIADSNLMSPWHDLQDKTSFSKYLKETSYGLSNWQLMLIRIYMNTGRVLFTINKTAQAHFIIKGLESGELNSDWNVVIYLNSELKHFRCFPENFGIQFAPRWFSSGITLPYGFHYLIFQCNPRYIPDLEGKKISKNFKEKGQGVTSLEEEVINNAISTASVIEKDNLFYNARYIYNSLFDTGEFWRVCIASENSKAILKYTSPFKAWIEYKNYGPQKWHYYIWRESLIK